MPHPFTGLVRGALELEETPRGVLPHRLPAHARAQSGDPQLAMAESQPSGVRLALRTSATQIELDVIPTKLSYVGAPPRPDGVYDLVVDGVLVAQASALGGDLVTADLSTGAAEHQVGSVTTVRFEGLGDQPKDVEIWLPWNERTELVDLRTDASVEPLVPSGAPVWVHHGSSISHGSDAASPTATWPAVAARLGGRELVNLGYAGSALLDQLTARTIRDTPADVISLKLGINVVNTDCMRLRAFGPAVHGFLDTIRDGHPTVPLLVVSPLLCPMHEETPGPGTFDVEALGEGTVRFQALGDPAEVSAGKLTLQVIREELAGIVAQRAATDPAIHYLDGLTLYGEADHDALPLPDALHPDGETHRLIGRRFADAAFGPDGAFAEG